MGFGAVETSKKEVYDAAQEALKFCLDYLWKNQQEFLPLPPPLPHGVVIKVEGNSAELVRKYISKDLATGSQVFDN